MADSMAAGPAAATRRELGVSQEPQLLDHLAGQGAALQQLVLRLVVVVRPSPLVHVGHALEHQDGGVLALDQDLRLGLVQGARGERLQQGQGHDGDEDGGHHEAVAEEDPEVGDQGLVLAGRALGGRRERWTSQSLVRGGCADITRGPDGVKPFVLRRARGQPTTKVGTLPPPALTLMTALREARVTAPTSRARDVERVGVHVQRLEGELAPPRGPGTPPRDRPRAPGPPRASPRASRTAAAQVGRRLLADEDRAPAVAVRGLQHQLARVRRGRRARGRSRARPRSVRRSSTRRVQGTTRATRSPLLRRQEVREGLVGQQPKNALSSERRQRNEFTNTARPSR